MSDIDSKHTTDSQPTQFGTFFWPAFAVVLLLGHVTLMMVAVSLANAQPPVLVEDSPYAAAPKSSQNANP